MCFCPQMQIQVLYWGLPWHFIYGYLVYSSSLAGLKLPKPSCPVQSFIGIDKTCQSMFQLFFLIACKISLIFVAFLFNFLFLCSPGRHRAVYILNAFGFINCYFFSKQALHDTFHLTAQKLQRFLGLPHCVGSFPNTLLHVISEEKSRGCFLLDYRVNFHTPFVVVVAVFLSLNTWTASP